MRFNAETRRTQRKRREDILRGEAEESWGGAAHLLDSVRIPGQAEQHSGLKPNTFWLTPECCSACARNVFHR